jgi:hypothetical protein
VSERDDQPPVDDLRQAFADLQVHTEGCADEYGASLDQILTAAQLVPEAFTLTVLAVDRAEQVSAETDSNAGVNPTIPRPGGPDSSAERAARQVATFSCPRGHDFEVPLASNAETPATWECRLHGGIAGRVDNAQASQRGAKQKIKPPRTHWDMLLERRSVAELDELLSERLNLLRERADEDTA